MPLTPIHDPSEGPFRCVGLMSGSGTNIRKILEYQESLRQREGKSPFEIVGLFSDRSDSQAAPIGKDFDLPVVIRDLSAYCKKRGVKRSDLDARKDFDLENLRIIESFDAKGAVYGGYMSVVTAPVIKGFLGVNVHPADLSVQNPDGSRKYVGDHGVRDAVAAGEKTIFATTHLVELEVDAGPILMISAPLEVVLEPHWDLTDPDHLALAETFNQNRLKEYGDWVIFPRTLEELARGRFSRDENGIVHYDGNPVPGGVRL